MNNKILVALFGAALAFGVWTVSPGRPLAQQASVSDGTVDIEASEMEILETDKRAVFRGDVVAKRQNETIRGEQMVVTYTDVKQPDGTSKSEVDTLDVTGNPVITTASQTITGEKARFLVRQDKLEVTGNVKVVQGKTVLRGPVLNVDLKTKRTVMSGGRVKGQFVPK